MVDDMQGGMAAGTPDAPLGSPGAQTPPPGPTDEGKKGFLSTTLGKVVAILGALLLLLVIAGAAAIIVFTFLLGDAADELADEVGETVTTTAPGTTPSQEGTVTDDGAVLVVETEPVTNFDVFVFRDIFESLLPDPPATSSGSVATEDTTDTTGGGGGGSEFEASTLYFISTETVNGEQVGVFYWNGVSYSSAGVTGQEGYIVIREGEQLADSAWRLLTLEGTTATVQYGDVVLTISVGQGITK
jgi:hypothetical protein